MKFKVLVLIPMLVMFLAACADPAPTDDILPIVDAPDLNVTPQPEEKNAYFTVVVTRLGEQAAGGGSIGWFASGEVYLKVNLDVKSGLNTLGTGFGKAGFDATKVCIDEGGWPVEYTAEGTFNVDTCELNLKIEETWPHTEAWGSCFGYSSSYTGPVYKLLFPSLKFEENDPREDTTRGNKGKVDEIYWMNTFLLYPKDGLEDTECIFNSPTP